MHLDQYRGQNIQNKIYIKLIMWLSLLFTNKFYGPNKNTFIWFFEKANVINLLINDKNTFI